MSLGSTETFGALFIAESTDLYRNPDFFCLFQRYLEARQCCLPVLETPSSDEYDDMPTIVRGPTFLESGTKNHSRGAVLNSNKKNGEKEIGRNE